MTNYHFSFKLYLNAKKWDMPRDQKCMEMCYSQYMGFCLVLNPLFQFPYKNIQHLYVPSVLIFCRISQDKPTYTDDFGDSDQEGEPDAYLARVKREAEERDEEEGGGSSDESEDEDFKPPDDVSDVAEE